LLDYDGLPDRYQTYRPGGPPIWLAAGNQAALGRAGRLYDGWLPYPPTAAGYAHGLAAVGEAATKAGRPVPTPALFATIAVGADESHGRRILADFCRDSYGAPLEYIESIQTTIAGPADHIQAELGRFVDAGTRHIIIRLPALEPGPQLDQLYLLAESVLSRP
jgi:alkanesulfonate monooxygenase SsuD/methylene tetrahydromethanopterin reductase-like flavin-dependent oxidoreductase (luciferase family)